jgi:hypothetical protein
MDPALLPANGDSAKPPHLRSGPRRSGDASPPCSAWSWRRCHQGTSSRSHVHLPKPREQVPAAASESHQAAPQLPHQDASEAAHGRRANHPAFRGRRAGANQPGKTSAGGARRRASPPHRPRRGPRHHLAPDCRSLASNTPGRPSAVPQTPPRACIGIMSRAGNARCRASAATAYL